MHKSKSTKKPAKQKESFFVSCPKGMETLLEEELKAIHISDYQTFWGGIEFSCPTINALELILSSRMASKVYKILYKFEVGQEQEIYQRAMEIKWKAIFSVNQSFKLTTNLKGNKGPIGAKGFSNSVFLSQLLKDAIADRFRKDCDNKRPSVELTAPDISIQMYINLSGSNEKKHQVSLMLDLCGDALSKRGYHQLTGHAPLKENLAAAIAKIIYDKNKNNFYLDPLCGSGTLLVEMALIALGIAPSYLKLNQYLNHDFNPWAFLDHLFYKNDEYLKKSFKKLALQYFEKSNLGFKSAPKQELELIGSDIDSNSLYICQQNLKLAKLSNLVRVSKKDVFTLLPPREKGIILCNPPYGQRLGQKDEIGMFYRDLGDHFKFKFPGYKAYIFTETDKEILKAIPLRPSQKWKFFNGNIECVLLEFELY